MCSKCGSKAFPSMADIGPYHTWTVKFDSPWCCLHGGVCRVAAKVNGRWRLLDPAYALIM